MNSFEKMFVQTNEHEMIRSKSFDLSNSGCLPLQSQISITSVSNAIANDPAQLPNFLGYSTSQNKSIKKLDTIYEYIPTSNVTNEINNQQSSEKKIYSIRGSTSSWKL